MTSIDDLFKGAGVSGKRKLEPLRDPDQIYKSVRLSSNGHSGRHARVEDEVDDDTEAGPAPPPEDDDYGPELPPDDDEGRFFGGGISKDEEEILDYVDGADESSAAPDKIDSAWLRKTALNFEKHISKNAELRAKFEDEPAKFIASEADLDADIKALSILGEHTELYAEFAKLGCVTSLVSLLAHENTDIAIDALEIINELTDEDVAAEEDQWNALVDALTDADLLGLLRANLERLDEKEEADRNGIYFALEIIENLSSRMGTAEQIGEDEKLIAWLLKRIQVKEAPLTQNKQYAAEILAILAQASAKNRKRLASLETADIMLRLVSSYRKRDPEKGAEEEEYMENLFEAMTCISDEPEGKAKLLEAEGIELCLIMLKEGKMSRTPALRLIDHAAGGPAGTEICLRLVEAGGLKTLFTMFMKKHDSQTTEHLIGVLSSMLRLLPGNSPERIRTLAKFVEKDYEKTEKLVKLRRDYANRIGAVDRAIHAEQARMSAEHKEEMADEWFSRRLDAGLFTLQGIDVILTWLIAEDDGASKKVKALLADRDETFAALKETIEEQLGGLDTETDDGKDRRDMLSTLIEFL